MIKQRKVKTTPMQKRAVDNILSGNYKKKNGRLHLKHALLDAGYAERSARIPRRSLAERRGVEIYLQKLSVEAKKRFNMELPEKVAMTYLDGLEATKLFGKDAAEHPDWLARKAFCDKFAEFFGWVHASPAPGGKYQFNFFTIPEEQRRNFNEGFKEFLARYYNNKI